jgi:hypothetical protein
LTVDGLEVVRYLECWRHAALTTHHQKRWPFGHLPCDSEGAERLVLHNGIGGDGQPTLEDPELQEVREGGDVGSDRVGIGH